jgi:5-methylcytosine-specific restriction endonuclease McrA
METCDQCNDVKPEWDELIRKKQEEYPDTNIEPVFIDCTPDTAVCSYLNVRLLPKFIMIAADE